MKKTKLAEAAKDLKLDNQELIDLLEKRDSVKRKNTTALNEDEMNYILEYYSQNNQVSSFDEYFESKNAKPEEKPEQPKEEKKPAKKTAKKAEAKEKKEQKTEKPKKDKTAAKAEEKPEVKEKVKSEPESDAKPAEIKKQ